MNLTKSQQEEIQKQRMEVIASVEGDSISPAARKLLENHHKRMIEKQKSEKLSPRNMELYVNLENDSKDNEENIMPAIERRVIKLNSNIPEDEDFGL